VVTRYKMNIRLHHIKCNFFAGVLSSDFSAMNLLTVSTSVVDPPSKPQES
jgi:hypothetical protein